MTSLFTRPLLAWADCIHLNLMKRGTHDHVTYFYSNL
ncbi:unnamed protein product, partial [Rotaria sordida]